MMGYPSVRIIEEVLREGIQIESPAITTNDKVRLLDMLSATGLPAIVVGSFVSPRWVPQMADIEDVLARFTPVAGVEYRALALNRRGIERRDGFVPPLSPLQGAERHQTRVHLCDVFVRRNTNRSQTDEIEAWPRAVERAVEEGAFDASISINAAWGSNWLGEFSHERRMDMLEAQYRLWEEAGIEVTRVWIGDPMGWNLPGAVHEAVQAVIERWPSIRTVHLHLHDTRGLALSSALAAIDALDSQRTLVLDSSVGGIGGCPYCGNGRATGMIATEDLVHTLHRMGIDTSVDLDAVIECAILVQQLIGRPVNGHVSKAGPCPRSAEQHYPMDLPLVATLEEAQHFRLGEVAHGIGVRPWKEPITSPMRAQGTHADADGGSRP